MKKNIFIFNLLFLATLVVATFSQTFAQKIVSLPYSVKFSEKEIQFLNSLSKTEFEKIMRIMKMIMEQHISSQTSRTQDLTQTTPAQTIYGNSQSAQTPYYNSGTGQYQSAPAGSNALGNNNSGIQNSNPYLGNNNALQQYLGQPPTYQAPPQTALGAMAQGLNLSTNQSTNQSLNVDNQRLAELFPETNTGGACADFGAVNRMGPSSFGGVNALSAKLKFDLSRLCQITGKRLVLTSGKRSTGSGFHPQGMAIDTALEPYSNEEKVIVMLYFMAHDYGGIGSYGNQPMHIDHRNYSMRWGPPAPYLLSYCKPGNYYPSVQKAFQLVGVAPCATPNVAAVTAKAKQVLTSLGKEDFAR